MLAENISPTALTATGLTNDLIYAFKVRTRNVVGWSEYSSEVSIRAAAVPATPVAPETAINGDSVTVTWNAPYNGGSELTSYTIVFREADGVTFTADSTSCDGTNSGILALHQCSIPIASLIAAPFNLPWGSSIYVKVTATNVVGSSGISDEGNNAIILTYPDEPINLANLPLITDSIKIGLTWADDAENGGTPIIDYRIWYDMGTGDGNYVILASNIVGQTFTATSLTADVVYSFKVQSRNNHGYSTGYSTVLAVRAAKLTTVPLNLANDPTMTGATSIKVTWDAPTDNGGSPVLDYRVSLKLTTDSTWTVLATDITLTYYTATSLTSDLIYDFKVEARNLVGYSPESTVVIIRAAAVPA